MGTEWGVPQISTAFYFGNETSNFKRFKNIGFHKSSSTSHWITDSAAGATAFSIGKKTEVPQKVAVYFNSDQHSGELIPVFAKGKGAENFQGIYDNSAIYHHILKSIAGDN